MRIRPWLIVFLLLLALVPHTVLAEEESAPASIGGANSQISRHEGISSEIPSIIYLNADSPRPTLGAGDRFEVHLINVASADCILLRSGELTMLVDSGNLSTADRVLAYLDTLGIDRLDYAFATHPHNDHVGGFVEILKHIPVGAFLQAALYEDFTGSMYKELTALLAELAIPMETIAAGTMMPFGAATLSFCQWEDECASVNNRSMALHAQHGNRAILLAADVENNGQKALAARYGDALAADILKMPHHGLVTYQHEFHNAVQPFLATFSNVKSNIEDTIRLTERRGVQWMLTTKGTIVCVSDGETWTVWQIPRMAQ